MKTLFSTLKNWRADLMGIALATLLLQVAALTPSAYFLHFDAPTQDIVAIELARGCWTFSTLKMLPVVMLAFFYKLFAPGQYWETALLMVWASVSIVCIYELTRQLSGSRLAGLFSSLLALALPAFQYFARIHLGYPMPFLLLGWLAARNKHWGWSGLCFGLAITAHYNSWVPVGLGVAALAVLSVRSTDQPKWARFGFALIAPLLAMDALFYLYDYERFAWNRGVFADVTRVSGLATGMSHSNWFWLVQTIESSNGTALSILLGAGIFAPFLLRHDKTGLAMISTYLALAALYTVQAGIGRALMVSRLLATAYPFWVIGVGIVFNFLLTRRAGSRMRPLLILSSVIGLVAAVVHTTVFMYQFTQTPYSFLEKWMSQAAAENRPVRYATGNRWIGLFFSQVYHLEYIAADDRWITAGTPGQAVLVFEDSAVFNLSRESYVVRTFNFSKAQDNLYPGLTSEANIPRRIEIWWPTKISSPIGQPDNPPLYTIYYSGAGCLSQPRFEGLHYYQFVLKRLAKKLGIESP